MKKLIEKVEGMCLDMAAVKDAKLVLKDVSGWVGKYKELYGDLNKLLSKQMLRPKRKINFGDLYEEEAKLKLWWDKKEPIATSMAKAGRVDVKGKKDKDKEKEDGKSK